MDDQSIRYTIGQMMALNHGKVSLSAGMAKLFGTYVNGLPAGYNNEFNVNRPKDNTVKKRTILTSATSKPGDVYQDKSILTNIRHIFGSLAKTKTDSTVAQINQISIPETMVKEVAELFFETCIQCPAVCDEYLDVLFRLKFPNGLEQKISYQFLQLLIKNYITPPVLLDSKLESGADRTRKYHTGTCLIFAKLFTYKFEATEQFKNPRTYFSHQDNLDKFLRPMFQKMQEGQTDALHNVATVYRMFLDKCPGKFNYAAYKTQLQSVYQNKDLFKLTVRLLLKDFI
jgi:hypothetical protein